MELYRGVDVPEHPLIGKLIRIYGTGPDAGLHSMSQFTADLGDGLMLARRLDPRTGNILAVSHIIALKDVARDTMATAIFDSWTDYMHSEKCPQESERIIKLVMACGAGELDDNEGESPCDS